MTDIILLSIYLFAAAVMDIAWRRVGNLWIVYGMVSGLALSLLDAGLSGNGGLFLDMGFPGLASSIAGLACAGVFIFLYAMGVLGAADVKLLMVSGCFMGAKCLFEVLPFLLAVAGIMSLLMTALGVCTKKEIRTGICAHYVPLAPALCLGVVVYGAVVM